MMIVSVNAEEIKLHGIPTGAYREHVHSVALEWQEENRYFLIPILPRFRLFFKEPNYFGFWQTWLRNLMFIFPWVCSRIINKPHDDRYPTTAPTIVSG